MYNNVLEKMQSKAVLFNKYMYMNNNNDLATLHLQFLLCKFMLIRNYFDSGTYSEFFCMFVNNLLYVDLLWGIFRVGLHLFLGLCHHVSP